MTWWNPKPLRPQADNTLFQFHEQPTVFKGVSPMQRQRQADGTPPTVSGYSALRPADPALTIKPDLVKGSLVEKIEEKNPRYGVPKRDPVEPMGVIKSYMAYKSEDKEDPDADSEEEMQEVNKASEHRDPEGGLTAAGRKHFNKKEGSNLKPGVKGKDADLSDAEKKRKGSFLTRHYKGEHNAKKPLKDEKGEPTRHALQAQAWGEPTPKNPSDRAKLVKDGERLLAQVNKSIEKAKRGWQDEDSVEKAALDKMFSSINKLSKACGGSYMGKSEESEDEDQADDDIEKGEAYTKPGLRERIKNQVMAGSDGGKPGQWSARKAQLLSQKYEAAGGGYKGSRTKEQQSLSKWTKEEWTTSDGEKADRKGGMRRYLPKEAWEKLSPSEKEATNKKKVEGSKKGEQFVSNTQAAKKARDKAQDKDDDKKVEKAALDKMFSSINNLTKACGGSYMVKADDSDDEQEESEEALESDENEDKSLTGSPSPSPTPKTPKPKKPKMSSGIKAAKTAGRSFGSGVVSAAAAPVKAVLGAARRI
jgi:hypothetical protein